MSLNNLIIIAKIKPFKSCQKTQEKGKQKKEFSYLSDLKFIYWICCVVIIQLTDSKLQLTFMTRVYNPYADQLKCNFCTQWFSCSTHFANIQRYSLNTCSKCLQNFRFTLVDSKTYKIYRLLLFDTGLTLPKIQNANNQNSNTINSGSFESKAFLARINLELFQVQEDIKSKICQYFQQQIKNIMMEVEKVQLIVQNECLKIRKQLQLQKQQFNEISLQKSVDSKINRLKEIPLEDWVNEPSSILKERQANILDKTISKISQSSNSHGKENLNPITKVNCARSIKSRILGFVPPLQKNKNVSKQSGKQSRILARSRSQSRSMVKSRKLVQSRKLQQSPVLHISNYQQLQRAEIIRLLNQKNYFQSYMQRQALKQESVIKKQDSQRNMVEEILQMREKSIRAVELLELIGGNAQKVNFDCYLRSLGNMEEVKTIRIIKSHLVDADFDYLLKFIGQHPSVQTLIVTNNRLTELSIEALQSFKQRHEDSKLSQAYFGNNFIKSNQIIQECQQLSRKGLEIFI